MKFGAAFVVLAIAVVAEASVIGHHAWGPALTVAGVHVIDHHHHDDGQWHGDNHWEDGHWHGHDHHWDDGHWDGHAHHWDGHHDHVAAIHLDAHHAGHSGSYVAANRGSVHSAPLVGHITSVKSDNTHPAPGTTW